MIVQDYIAVVRAQGQSTAVQTIQLVTNGSSVDKNKISISMIVPFNITYRDDEDYSFIFAPFYFVV